MNEKKLPLNSLHLKLLAAASMLVDHMGFTLFPFAHWMRCVGRLAFPIFCFLMAEGCAHTRDKKRYAVRLLLFALLSELPFNLMCTGQWFSLQYQNVLWTLLLGALVCWAMDWAKTKPEMWQRLPADAAIAVGFILGQWGNTDYGGWGVLLVLLGQGTKIASHLLADGGKVYSGQLRLGLTTDTWDIQGEVLTESPWQQVTEADVRAEVAHWLTLHEQEVPAYSAAKHEGQSLYKLARKGKEVPKKVKSMEISQADVLEVELPFVRFRVACSSGTYIRSLAHSLGMRLGCGAVLTELTREYSHPFGLEVACGLDELSADPGLLVKHLRPLAEALPHWPVLELDEAAEARIRNGMAIPCRDDVGDKALLQRQGMPLALARRSETPQGPCWTVLRGLWN